MRRGTQAAPHTGLTSTLTGVTKDTFLQTKLEGLFTALFASKRGRGRPGHASRHRSAQHGTWVVLASTDFNVHPPTMRTLRTSIPSPSVAPL